MSVSWETPAEIQPQAGQLTTLWIVPLGSQGAFLVTVTNTSTSAAYFRISVARASAADSKDQYKAYDLPLTGRNVYEQLVTLTEGDEVRVQSSTGLVSFSIMGGRKF